MDKANPAPGAAPLGLAIFLVSLAVLFAASLVGYWAVRLANPAWSDGLPALPSSLWGSTLVLVASSVTMHLALRAAKRGDSLALGRSMTVTTALGLVFLAGQLWAWSALVDLNLTGRENLYGFTFYLLTALHALHVIAGLVPLGITTRRAFVDRYSAESYDGVLMCAMYWHFLDVVWLIIFANLVLV